MATYPVLQITEGEWTSRRYYNILGMRIPAYFTNDPVMLSDYISSFQTRPDDVFVVSYPKSGTTWVKEIVWQIYNNGEISSENSLYRVPFLEMATDKNLSRSDLKTMGSPRLMMTHLPYSVIPKSSDVNTQCKYIYVARNPKDVAVSYFHFVDGLKAHDGAGYNGPWEFFVKLFMEGEAGWCSWNNHVLDWWQHKDNPNVLFLKYEDLQKDLPSHVQRIAKFLSKPLSDELIGRIAEQCTFKGMTKNLASHEFLGEGDSVVRFLRKGVVGDWKNYFTPEMNEQFDEKMLENLKGSGLEFDYEI